LCPSQRVATALEGLPLFEGVRSFWGFAAGPGCLKPTEALGKSVGIDLRAKATTQNPLHDFAAPHECVACTLYAANDLPHEKVVEYLLGLTPLGSLQWRSWEHTGLTERRQILASEFSGRGLLAFDQAWKTSVEWRLIKQLEVKPLFVEVLTCAAGPTVLASLVGTVEFPTKRLDERMMIELRKLLSKLLDLPAILVLLLTDLPLVSLRRGAHKEGMGLHDGVKNEAAGIIRVRLWVLRSRESAKLRIEFLSLFSERGWSEGFDPTLEPFHREGIGLHLRYPGRFPSPR
jgi:hypothetical protein